MQLKTLSRAARVLATALTGLSACATPPSPVPTASTGGDDVPIELELPGLTGKNVRLADLRGQVVLLDMWATWCKPCLTSFPFYAELEGRFRERGFRVLAVSVDREDEDVRAFLEKNPVPFLVARDPTGKTPERFAIETMPTALLIGRDGRLLRRHEGFRPSDKESIARWVEAALREGASPPPG